VQLAVNEPKSARYHRLQRCAGLASLLVTATILAAALWIRPSLPLWAYVIGLVGLNALVNLPMAYYRGVILERRYDLSSESRSAWARDQLKALAIGLVFALAAAEFLYVLIRWNPTWWWIPAGLGAGVFTILLAWLAPVLLLPLFYKFTPLDRPALRDRLLSLSEKAGVPVLGVYEWALGAKTRRANAALTGSGKTRRILLSDTLLAQYSDDEIEVILAHELAHHVHRDIPKGLVLEVGLTLVALMMASAALRYSVSVLGLDGPADPRGLPLVLLVGGAVMLAVTPLLNSLSRHNERRADRFALDLTGRGQAFVTAMRRLGAQNLSEENPSRLSVWLFHTHPPIEERIASAQQAPS
jgi:STE24 endopeptidase